MSGTPHDDPAHDPAPDDAVRRLLAGARHTEPLPPEVAGRLDALLGELVEARSSRSGVTSLAARRRQRRRLLLVAAAAAVVVGVAVPSIDRAGSSSDDAGSTAADSSASSASRSQADTPEAAVPDAPAGAASNDGAASPLSTKAPMLQQVAPVALTTAGFDAEVRALLRGPASVGSAYDLSRTSLPQGCTLPSDASFASVIAATYDGLPALLATSLPSLGEQRADLFVCGESGPVRMVTVDLAR